MNEIPLNVETEDKYVIHIQNFDGPLDLLWSLILKAKIDVTEVSISSITEQYIAYLKLMETMNIKVAAEFVALASELLYYKSKALLPSGEIEDEYFIPPMPPDLVQKLLEYKKYQMTSERLKAIYELEDNHFYRDNVITEDKSELLSISLFDLLKAFSKVLEKSEPVEQEEVVFNEVLVSDRIEYISALLEKNNQVIFQDVFSLKPTRVEIVATFLAILEMAKMRKIKLIQQILYGDIVILPA